MLARIVLFAVVLGSGLIAQARVPAQLRLSDALIRSFISAQSGLTEVGRDIRAEEAPSPAILARLEKVARQNGFASFAQLDDVAYSISIVFAGIDHSTGAYESPRAVYLREIKSIEADATIPAADRDQLVAELRAASQDLEDPLPGNVDVVTRHAAAILRAL